MTLELIPATVFILAVIAKQQEIKQYMQLQLYSDIQMERIFYIKEKVIQ